MYYICSELNREHQLFLNASKLLDCCYTLFTVHVLALVDFAAKVYRSNMAIYQRRALVKWAIRADLERQEEAKAIAVAAAKAKAEEVTNMLELVDTDAEEVD